jgi:hypothetical protein
MKVHVEAYSGYTNDERPLRFQLKGSVREVLALIDQWYAPDAKWFKVEADDRQHYVLRHSLEDDSWTLESLVRN